MTLHGEAVLENEYDLKRSLKAMNQRFIVLVKERDEMKANLMRSSNALDIARKKEVHRARESEQALKNEMSSMERKMKGLCKGLEEAQRDSKSHKNILNTYNVMSPSADQQQKQIGSLHGENERLCHEIKVMERMKNENESLSKELEAMQSKESEEAQQNEMEMEGEHLNERIEFDVFNPATMKAMEMKVTPLTMAMEENRNEQRLRVEALEKMVREIEERLKMK